MTTQDPAILGQRRALSQAVDSHSRPGDGDIDAAHGDAVGCSGIHGDAISDPSACKEPTIPGAAMMLTALLMVTAP